jgi:hypothetical protein
MLCFCLGLLFYRSTKIATQNKLWAGMAKETASNRHATLPNRMGRNLEIGKCWWINNDWDWKDIERLQTITDRFSKIGSEPKKKDIVEETLQSYTYLQSRFSKYWIHFRRSKITYFRYANPTLHSWTIETLSRTIDAMKGRGKLALK